MILVYQLDEISDQKSCNFVYNIGSNPAGFRWRGSLRKEFSKIQAMKKLKEMKCVKIKIKPPHRNP